MRVTSSCPRNAAGWPSELDLVCRWYGPHLERIHEDAALREADLVQLAQIASTYPSRERFLTELTLDPPDATSDEAGAPLLDEDYLILSTIHSAKGQEWAAVFSAQHGRWVSAIRSCHRLNAGNRGGTSAAVCRHDASQGPTSPDGSAAKQIPTRLNIQRLLHPQLMINGCANRFLAQRLSTVGQNEISNKCAFPSG